MPKLSVLLLNSLGTVMDPDLIKAIWIGVYLVKNTQEFITDNQS